MTSKGFETIKCFQATSLASEAVNRGTTQRRTDKMDQPIPDWVNKDFLTKCLQKEDYKENIIVTNFTASPAVPPGNNYGSFVIRVKVEYKFNEGDPELHNISLIIKSELTDSGPMKNLASEFSKNEPAFYSRFIPMAKKFTDMYFAPKSFFSPMPNIPVLEDLKDKGFVMADRLKQLDFHHCRLYMTAAASMHAVSVAVYKKHPEILEPIKKDLVFSHESSTHGMFINMIKSGMKCFVKAVDKVDKYKEYSKLLKSITPHLWNMLVDSHKPSEFFNTIRQGDPWITNMMFKYDKDGNVCDIKLVDFQATQYGSPVTDIMFFIWSSANNDVKKSKLKELYRIYVDTLNEKLEKFKFAERLNYQPFIANVEKLAPLAIFIAACMLPSITNAVPADFSVFLSEENESKSENPYKKYYDENFCNNYLPNLLECLELNGVFDYL